VLPYHDYLEPTGDEKEDVRRAGLLQEIAVAANEARTSKSFIFNRMGASPAKEGMAAEHSHAPSNSGI